MTSKGYPHWEGDPPQWYIEAKEHWRKVRDEMTSLKDLLAKIPDKIDPLKARPRSEYHQDMGAVLWWKFPITEPPYVGGDNFPERFTHFTEIMFPNIPGEKHDTTRIMCPQR